jgi:hypothetical protein
MKVLTNEDWVRSLSKAESDAAEAIEAEVNALLGKGLTEEVALRFIRTVMALRILHGPKIKVSGTLEAVFLAGLERVAALAVKDSKPKRVQVSKKGQVRGV